MKEPIKIDRGIVAAFRCVFLYFCIGIPAKMVSSIPKGFNWELLAWSFACFALFFVCLSEANKWYKQGKDQ